MTNKSNLNKIISFDDETVVYEYKREIPRSNSYQNEDQMEKDFIKQLISQGYEYLNDVKDEQSLIINLRKQIEELNNYQFSDNEWSQFFNSFIANQQDDIEEKTDKIQNNFKYVLNCDNGQIKNINIIDKKNVHNNKLQVINQYVNDQGKHNNRYDVSILVNGIPLVHIELKRRGILLKEAFNQIERYKLESFSSSSGLFNFVQIFVISNGTDTKYYANTIRKLHIKNKNNQDIKSKTSHSFEFTNYWSDAQNNVINDIEDFAKTFFAKHTLLNVLTKYCIYTSERHLLVMRPYQIVATERILNKINISHNYPEKLGTIEAGGYIWHTTGSGKTVTSFKAAQLATQQEYIDKVLFVVDRKDLDYQTIKEYDRFEKGAANSNRSTEVLKKQLEDDKAKIIITTIQKLSIFIKDNPKHLVYKKHVVIIFDECHRSQFGDMHHSITSNFKKYNIFGFTGTPIFAKNATIGIQNHTNIANEINKHNLIRTTEQLFGTQLHRYTILNATIDKNVLPFKYSEIKTFFEKEDIEDTKVKTIDKEKVWIHPERIKLVTKYIIDHFNQATYRNETYQHTKITNSVEPAKDKKNEVKQKKEKFNAKGFNSLFAVSSIDAAKLYYSEFKKQLKQNPNIDLKVGIIYSFSPNETLNDVDGLIDDENNESTNGLDQNSREFLDQAIQDYNQIFNTAFDSNGDNFQSYYKDVSMRLKNKELDILIVVNMFLTGFDATTLNTLWVDKWLKMHGLIQAFSRTNRILNSIKQFGNIISFRPLQKRLNEAISLFSDEESSGLILIKSFNDYYNGYTNTHGLFEPGYKQLVTNLFNKFPLNECIVLENEKKEFIKAFGEVLQVRNILLVFDEFKDKEIFEDRDLQDYLSWYQDFYQELRNKEKAEKVDITGDLVFEIELIKQIDLGIDYIFNLINELRHQHIENREIISSISKALDASFELRSKKELIIEFLRSLESKEISININEIEDIINEFNKFKAIEMEKDLSSIINEYNLKPIETKEYIDNSFKLGELRTIGNEIEKILPKISRFSSSNDKNRLNIKKEAIIRLQQHFDKYFNI